MVGCSSGVTVHPPTPTGAVSEKCAQLGNVLPEQLGTLRPRVISPRTPLAHAWGDPAIVLTCGVVKPPGYSATSAELTVVDGVSWFEQLPDSKVVVWTAIRPGSGADDTVYVQLRVPTHYESQGGFLVHLAKPLKAAFP